VDGVDGGGVGDVESCVKMVCALLMGGVYTSAAYWVPPFTDKTMRLRDLILDFSDGCASNGEGEGRLVREVEEVEGLCCVCLRGGLAGGKARMERRWKMDFIWAYGSVVATFNIPRIRYEGAGGMETFRGTLPVSNPMLHVLGRCRLANVAIEYLLFL